MLILDVNKVSKNFGFGELFKNVTFSLGEAQSISIVGENGCGKSTLLKIIAGIEKPDSGTVSIKKDARVVYLDQTTSSFNDNRTVIEILNSSFCELNEIEKNLNYYQLKMEKLLNGKEFDEAMNKYCNLIERFGLLGGYDKEVVINTVCEGLKINKSILNQNYNQLSGGEKTLVYLAKSLIVKPDLLLLDEPTNHLDIERMEWLEDYIKSFKGASVIVSHDRYFLNKMSNQILSIENGTAKIYKTNYSGFIEEKQKNFEIQLELFKDQQDVVKRFESQIKYYQERGMATNSSTLCDRAHSLQSQLERFKKNMVAKPIENKKLNLNFNLEKKFSKKIISLKNLSVCSNIKCILQDVSFEICAGERVAIIGNNGSGKSTLIKFIMNTQDEGLEFNGEINVGESAQIGYVPQIINFENDQLKLLEFFKNEIAIDEQKAREILFKLKFNKEDINKKIKNLSGGEKIRVILGILLQQKVNTLIFDEPTNHIDIETKEVLENALQEFSGTLIFVSHDRYFINKFAEKIIEIKNTKSKIYNGNYDFYKSKR